MVVIAMLVGGLTAVIALSFTYFFQSIQFSNHFCPGDERAGCRVENSVVAGNYEHCGGGVDAAGCRSLICQRAGICAAGAAGLFCLYRVSTPCRATASHLMICIAPIYLLKSPLNYALLPCS